MDSKELLDRAFRQARRKKLDLEKIQTAYSIITGFLKERLSKTKISLTRFELEILKTMINFQKFESNLKKIENSLLIIQKIKNEYEMKIKYGKTESKKFRKAFYGRLSSIVKKIDFEIIEDYLKAVEKLPRIKLLPTIIICGYPNVGKSLLLKQLTGHKVKIASYPFTTKQILIGYFEKNYEKIQIVDMPGLLDRPLEKRNKIELQAICALKNLSRKILFVLDPSETCGYPLESQIRLMEEIRKQFKPEIIIVATKKDLPCKKTEADLFINSNDLQDIEKVKQKICEMLNA